VRTRLVVANFFLLTLLAPVIHICPLPSPSFVRRSALARAGVQIKKSLTFLELI